MIYIVFGTATLEPFLNYLGLAAQILLECLG
nr:MAG TPA: hypothetical protein [Caudoviricetes sp.]